MFQIFFIVAGIEWCFSCLAFTEARNIGLSAESTTENNCCCSVERSFKVKKHGIFLYGISSFILEIFTFLYLIGGYLKQYNT